MKLTCDLDNAILSICENQWDFFFRKANVVGVALGYKRKKDIYTCQKSIIVFVSKKVPAIALSKENLIPLSYNGIITDVVESGIFYEQSLTNKIRPVIGGYGISNVTNAFATGTFGCMVTDGKFDYILSCNHVLALRNTSPLATPIVQPAILDGGNPTTDVIAVLAKYIPLNFITPTSSPTNFTDSALGLIVNPAFVIPSIAFIGPPKGTRIPVLHEDVKKIGAISERTTGIIIALGATITLESLVGPSILLKRQILTTKMSQPGDSGAILLNKDNYALGLLCGGTNSVSCFNLIDLVLGLLGVTLVTKK